MKNTNDCFALADNQKCGILTKKQCENCSFYKTKTQYLEDKNKYSKLTKFNKEELI